MRNTGTIIVKKIFYDAGGDKGILVEALQQSAAENKDRPCMTQCTCTLNYFDIPSRMHTAHNTEQTKKYIQENQDGINWGKSNLAFPKNEWRKNWKKGE